MYLPTDEHETRHKLREHDKFVHLHARSLLRKIGSFWQAALPLFPALAAPNPRTPTTLPVMLPQTKMTSELSLIPSFSRLSWKATTKSTGALCGRSGEHSFAFNAEHNLA